MKTLSLWQPWASLIGRGKTIETRSWSTAYRGPLAIHAGKFWTQEQWRLCFGDPFYSLLRDADLMPPIEANGRRDFHKTLPFGAIVATCLLVDCVPTAWIALEPELTARFYKASGRLVIPTVEWQLGDYGMRRFGWVLEDIQILPQPIPCQGAQRLFQANIPETMLRSVS